MVDLWRSRDGKVRSLWRIIGFVLVFLGLGTLFALPVELLNARYPMSKLAQQTLQQIAFVLALLAATRIMLRAERRSWDMVFLHRDALQPRQLMRGTALGLLPILVSAALLVVIGWLTFVPAADESWLFAALSVTVFLLVAAFGEELLARGYPFAVMRESVGPIPAIIVTSLVFGILHARNPGANVQSIAAVTLAGVFLSVLLLATGSLYAAALGHAAWNWLMAVPLHAPVSGLDLPAPDYRAIDSGPDWATGGTWGPESGLPASLVMILLLVYMIRSRANKYPKIFHRIVPALVPQEQLQPHDSNG